MLRGTTTPRLALHLPLPEVPHAPTEDNLTPLRACIDEIDLLLLKLLNERAYCAAAIGHIKKQLGLPVYVPSRESDVLRNVTSANEGPLHGDAVRRLFERVIDETRSFERQQYQDNLSK